MSLTAGNWRHSQRSEVNLANASLSGQHTFPNLFFYKEVAMLRNALDSVARFYT